MKETTKGRLFMLLFALPFAGVDIGFLVSGDLQNYRTHPLRQKNPIAMNLKRRNWRWRRLGC
jgi:hypothetical protein